MYEFSDLAVTQQYGIIHHSSYSTVLRIATVTLFIKIHTRYYFLLMQFANAEIRHKVNKEVRRFFLHL